MKRLSIKLKITLLITVIMTIVSVSMMLYAMNIAVKSAENELKETLRVIVDDLYGTITYEELMNEPEFPEEPEFPKGPDFPKEPGTPNMPPQYPNNDRIPNKEHDKDFVLSIPEGSKYELNGVMMFVTGDSDDSEEKISEGALPEAVVLPESLTADDIIKVNGHYLYCRYIPMPGEKGGGAWVCGTIDTKMSHSIAYDTLMQALLALPFIILLTAILSYLITKRAFRPIAKITKAAGSIASSNNLSERLDMGDGKDEINVLASTFDGMLDTIERNFEKEKQFTADASHELRTPVAVIMAQSELAMDPNATHEDRNEAINSINRQSRKMNKLLSELLALARSDNKCEVLEREPFDLYELAEMVIDDQIVYAEEKGISIELKGEEGTTLNADITQIMRVLINLINNAVKYGKDGGKVIVTVKSNNDGKVFCAVEDDGIGIEAEDLKRIWNRFYRVDSARTADGTGSMGLGLSMVKNIIESHGGTVMAESEPGKGSVFSFTL